MTQFLSSLGLISQSKKISDNRARAVLDEAATRDWKVFLQNQEQVKQQQEILNKQVLGILNEINFSV